MPRFTFALRLSFISVALCRVAIGNIGGAADVAEEAAPAVLGRNGRVHTAVPAIHRHARAARRNTPRSGAARSRRGGSTGRR